MPKVQILGPYYGFDYGEDFNGTLILIIFHCQAPCSLCPTKPPRPSNIHVPIKKETKKQIKKEDNVLGLTI